MINPPRSKAAELAVIQGKLELVRDLAVSLDNATKTQQDDLGDVNWLGVAQEIHTNLESYLVILEAELTTLQAAPKGLNL